MTREAFGALVSDVLSLHQAWHLDPILRGMGQCLMLHAPLMPVTGVPRSE